MFLTVARQLGTFQLLMLAWAAWCTESCKGMQLGQLTPTDQRGYSILYDSCLLCKSGRKKKQGGGERLEWWLLSSQVTVMSNGALLSWRRLGTCLPMRSCEWTPCFALLACVTLALHIKLSLSQSTSFLIFTLLILSPIPPGVGRGVSMQLCGA